ncbi:hypothetical protein GCM10009616_04300 [Microlunatus lacustris]
MARPSVPLRALLVLGLSIVLVAVLAAVWSSADPEDPCRHHLDDSTVESQRAYSACRQEQGGDAGGAPTAPTDENAASRILGPAPSGLPWHSGVWLGGRFTTGALDEFGAWRGRPADVVTTYSAKSSYQAIMDEDWHITVWNGFNGRLNYGLAMLPEDGDGSLVSVARGDQDAVWTEVARKLVDNGRGDSIIRVGWESNLPDWPWQASAESADEYQAAFRRIVTTMRSTAPDLVFEFGVACGSGLPGTKDRLAALTEVYPGDDVVDLIGCDTYDWYDTQASSAADWQDVLLPAKGPGIQDVVDFARQRGKGASFAEWGLAKKAIRSNGGGDNPYYVEAMYNFFNANRDVVVFECYFDEPTAYIKNSLFGTDQNPKAAAVYQRLW